MKKCVETIKERGFWGQPPSKEKKSLKMIM